MVKPYGFILLLILSGLTSSISAQSSESVQPVFRESAATTHSIPDGQAYRFGYLEVPEVRGDTGSGTIEIPVYIFESRNPDPEPDPVIYTVGGPGSSTMPSAQYMKYYTYLNNRDVILVEQRGTRYARPHLACPDWALAVHTTNQPGFNDQNTDSLLASAARHCRQQLTASGIDLKGYSTNAIAADIDDLASVLGIEQYNLLTISYSTKIAQVLLRDHPGRIRSVVMDSPLPLQVHYDEASTDNLMHALTELLDDCESQPACQTAYPGLKQRFFHYLRAKTKDPLEVTVKKTETGDKETFYLKGKDLISVFTSSSTGSYSEVPYQIERILNGDLSEIKERLTDVFDEPGSGEGIGMRLSVWCAEEYPFSDPRQIREATQRYTEIAGLSPAVFSTAVCEAWNVPEKPAIENRAVHSTVPVLLISGEYDAETPSGWAELMQEHLPNSYHLLFEGWGHTPTTYWSNQCAMKSANAFFNDPSQIPDPPCKQELSGPAFRTK